MPDSNEVTRLLNAVARGHEDAGEALLPLVYEELRGLARTFMRFERQDHTLQTTALVHEAWLRLAGGSDAAWEDRTHFFRLAARAMRRVLVDHARTKKAQKRGRNAKKTPLETQWLPAVDGLSTDLLDLDGALEDLSDIDPKMAQVVELRFFGGFSVNETARILSVSERTIKSDWRLARPGSSSASARPRRHRPAPRSLMPTGSDRYPIRSALLNRIRPVL